MRSFSVLVCGLLLLSVLWVAANGASSSSLHCKRCGGAFRDGRPVVDGKLRPDQSPDTMARQGCGIDGPCGLADHQSVAVIWSREGMPGNRHKSLIFGSNLADVVITGENGTIDGQGSGWWQRFRNKTLDYTKAHHIDLMNSIEVVISNLTLLNSLFRTVHPVYSSHVTVQNLTIRAPSNSPNTDGIDLDSSDHVCIEDCYISTGDDVIAIKSSPFLGGSLFIIVTL